MSTLITKLFRKNRILTICPLVSDCTIGRNICFPYTIWLKSRRKTQPLPVYVSAGIFHIRSNNFLARGFSISRLLHHHIRTHANIMTLDAVDTEYVTKISYRLPYLSQIVIGQDIVLGIFHIRSNNCLANERFFD